jgi:hypothetical protein
MPAWILAALAAFAAALPVVVAGALLVGPFVLPLWLKQLKEADRVRLRDATKGAYDIVSVFARSTPTNIDDMAAQVLQMVEQEVGKTLKPSDAAVVSNIAKALHAREQKARTR